MNVAGSGKHLMGLGVLMLALTFVSGTVLAGDIPDETFEVLGVDRDGEPADLYDALEWRYHDAEEGAGEGSHADYWDPIPFSKYTNPTSFYEPPDKGKGSDREGCVECHVKDTAGHVMGWKKSVHAKLSTIRNLAPNDPRYYKTAKLKKIETNLVSLGLLDEGQILTEVSCMDCHVEILRTAEADHKRDLRLPDAAVCGTCHLEEFAERESERDTLDWPHEQWPAGRPSHALDYSAIVEMTTWAAMSEREIAEGCATCHSNQNKCDSCHTRHEFSAAEARKPEACATCHNGPAHNEYENYMLSKHGTIYQTSGDEWNWDMPLSDAVTKNGQTAPTCVSCHFEYRGKFGHNMVRKVRWASTPKPDIADNLDDKWFQSRKEAWVATCARCHSESFGRAFLEMMDNGIKAGLKVEQDAKQVITALYDEGLLVGQTDNRPSPPEPVVDEPGGFFQLFMSNGNNPSAIEIEHARRCRYSLANLYKGLAHSNPGGWAYGEGWSPLVECYARIKDADTQIRAMAEIRSKLASVDGPTKFGLLNRDGTLSTASLGGLGGILLLIGGLGMLRRRDEDVSTGRET